GWPPSATRHSPQQLVEHCLDLFMGSEIPRVCLGHRLCYLFDLPAVQGDVGLDRFLNQVTAVAVERLAQRVQELHCIFFKTNCYIHLFHSHSLAVVFLETILSSLTLPCNRFACLATYWLLQIIKGVMTYKQEE